MQIRFFAGAAEAAGMRETTVEGAATVADVVAHLGADNPRLARVLDAASLLMDGRSVTDRSEPATGERLDVLPPFAGG